MSPRVTFADNVKPACVRRTQIDFWDGMKHGRLMPKTTAKDRKAVWDAVSVYIQEHLLLHQGVRIPALGSFDVVPRWVKLRNETITFLKPVFYLARNLRVSHNLMDNKEYLPGHKELEPLKFAEVAAATSVSWKKVEGCIRGTTSLISHCLGKGENIALVLRDLGVLLIKGTKVQMKFYYEFLEMLSGKENLKKVRVLFSPRPGQPHKVAAATFALGPTRPLGLELLASLLGWPRAAVLPAPAALGSSRTEWRPGRGHLPSACSFHCRSPS
ncbi:coiled-coil domain-containing protein 81-like isoform X1 [Anser cygnoides]|uniref:coiled-coil domain-containing protein 81-like isoform X2 n=1 Tax=Anser cygnoides TaxID=8845 RepID=UPI0034D176A0